MFGITFNSIRRTSPFGCNVSGFRDEDDARAFADWLSDIPFDEDGGEEVLVH